MVKPYQGLPRLTTAISVSLLILLTATHARPVDEVVNDTIQQWNATEPHRLEQRWIQCDWAHIATIVTQPLQDSDDHCTLAAKKGHRLVCMMVNPTTQRSVYQEARELAFYGYESQVAGNDIQPGLSNINEALRGAGLTDEPTQWFYLNQFHVRDSGDFPSTNAFFQNHASPAQGAIIAFNNKNPEMMNHDSLSRTLDADQVVPLKQWSDVFFLGWKEACRASRGGVANMQRLEHVFRDNVINQGTIEVLRSIVGKDYLGVRDMWPGFQYSFGDVRMRAALGTPNGNGLAWLVGQHQAEIGKKIVDRVHIFNCGSQFGDAWCLYFHLRAF